jgi:Glycosyl hydrolases family 16
LGKTITVDFTQGASSEFNLAEGTSLTYDSSQGAVFTINEETDAPTITSNWYIFFGKVDIVLKAAPGVGIVSSFVMESDDLDEIDLVCLICIDFIAPQRLTGSHRNGSAVILLKLRPTISARATPLLMIVQPTSLSDPHRILSTPTPSTGLLNVSNGLLMAMSFVLLLTVMQTEARTTRKLLCK